ncbi:putative short-chain dehydrogenase, partial [Mycena polygramma]
GTTGIGYETVKQLLLKNAKAYLAARSPEKAAAAMNSLEAETKKSAIFLELDLADLNKVRSTADTFLSQESKLDILFNNGSIVCPPLIPISLKFGTNAMGHFLLTELLI